MKDNTSFGALILNKSPQGIKILIVKQREYPCKLGLPKGHIEPKENRHECINREILEEVGIDLEKKDYQFRDMLSKKFDLIIYINIVPEVKIDEDELLYAEWMDLKEVVSTISSPQSSYRYNMFSVCCIKRYKHWINDRYYKKYNNIPSNIPSNVEPIKPVVQQRKKIYWNKQNYKCIREISLVNV